MALLSWLFIIVAAANPVLYSSGGSRTAYPGDLFRAQGANINANTTIEISYAGQPPTVLTAVNYDNGFLTAIVPVNFAFGVYTITLIAAGARSARSNLINQQVGQWTDMNQVNVGNKFQVFGWNLYFSASGHVPKVTFMDISNGTKLMATLVLTESDNEVLTAIAPQGFVDGRQYRIQLDNGYGYPSFLERDVVGRNGKDILGAGVGWAVDFDVVANHTEILSSANNAAADDTARFASAVSAAVRSAGAGIISFGPGDFYLRSVGLQLPDGVVLAFVGAPDGSTVIHYGWGNTGDSTKPIGRPPQFQFYSNNMGSLAFVNITFQNDEKTNYQERFLYGGGTPPHVICLNAHFKLGFTNDGGFSTGQTLIVRSTFTQDGWFTSASNDYIRLGGYSLGNSIVKSSSFLYYWGYVGIDFSQNTVIQNSSIIRDLRDQIANYNRGVPLGSNFGIRGLNANFVQNFAFLKSTIDVLNHNATVTHNANDGEAILDESGGPNQPPAQDGNCTSATAFSFTDSRHVFDYVNSQPGGWVLGITAGTGFGQVRHVTSSAVGGVLTIDAPWDIIPATDSMYALGRGSTNWLIKDSTFMNHDNGACPQINRGSNITVTTSNYYNMNAELQILGYALSLNAEGGNIYGISSEIYFYDNYIHFDRTDLAAGYGFFELHEDPKRNILYAIGGEARNNVVERTGDTSAYPSDGPQIYMDAACVDGFNMSKVIGNLVQGEKLPPKGDVWLSIVTTGTTLACNHGPTNTLGFSSIYCNGIPPLVNTVVLPNACRNSSFSWGSGSSVSSSFALDATLACLISGTIALLILSK